MNNRLNAILNRIPFGKGVIDVGTDHGYIPAALAQQGYPGRIIASDINPGPLESARKTAEEYSAADRIEFLLCDGLEDCESDAVDTIVIAGMGGDTICGILDRADWCIAPGYTFVLQPMTKSEILRYWLINNGFEISEEAYIRDGNIYQLIVARFGSSEKYLDAELYTGKLEPTSYDHLFEEYLDLLINRFEKSLTGMLSSDKDRLRAKVNRNILSELKTMKLSYTQRS